MKIESLLVAVLLVLPALGFAADPSVLPKPTNPANPENLPSLANPTTPAAPMGPANPAVQKSQQNLDQPVAVMMTAFNEAQHCFEAEASLKAELARKKASLAEEFNGKIPLAFEDLLWQKTQRIAKQHNTCFQDYQMLGGMFESLDRVLRAIDLKKANNRHLKTIVDAQKAKFLLMLPTAKKYGKTPTKK